MVPGARQDPGATFKIAGDRSTITTAALQMTIRHDPFRISMADAQGNSLDEDDPQNGIAFSGSTVRVWKRLRDDEQVYGLGSKTGDFNKRGRQLGGYNYTMWNSDTFAYDLSTDPIYVSVPFFLVLRGGRSHGIFFDNTFRSNFDIGHQSQGRLSFGADGGELNYYFINGPDPKSVINRYTALTGRMPLPPRWALGYHQCRYSYYPDSKVRFIAQNFRERRIPADVIWLDIHYLEGFNPFTWDPQRFPDPPGLIADLRRLGLRLGYDRRRPSQEGPRLGAVRFGPRRRSPREEPGRQRVRSAGVALAGGKESGAKRLPRLQQAGGQGMVGWSVRSAGQSRSRGDLERHERARDIRHARRRRCP